MKPTVKNVISNIHPYTLLLLKITGLSYLFVWLCWCTEPVSVSHASSSVANTYKLELLTGSSKGNQSGTVEKINDKIIKDIHRLSHSTSWKEPKEKNNQIYVIILHSSKYKTCYIMINTLSSSCCSNAGCITSCSIWFRKCSSQHMIPC